MSHSPDRLPLPLDGVRILDLTTLVPGPLATLALSEAGASVLKIERPSGDEARGYEPKVGTDSGIFALLNRGKRSLALDLKHPDDHQRFKELVREADVLVEQFRPGVMARLGLAFEQLRKINPRLIYCSMTGYGQTGPMKDVAAHDLNYVGNSGLLSLVASPEENPQLPPALIADIGGGSYPAIINILLALLRRHATGEGCHIDIAMAENVLPFMYWALAKQQLSGTAPIPGGEMVSGGTARYQIYRTADDRFLTVAPVEDRFWSKFCDVIGLGAEFVAERDVAATKNEVARLIRSRTVREWTVAFAGIDVCVGVVLDVEQALGFPQFVERGVFDGRIAANGNELVALPMPLDRQFKREAAAISYPTLNDAGAGSGWDIFTS